MEITAVETLDAGSRLTTGSNGLPQIRLSDGRVARFTRKPKGKDSELAIDNSGKKQNNMRATAVLLSRIVTIDNAPVNPEQILDLDLDDLNFLGENLPGNF
jgi:hypothetical protein